MPMGRYYQSKQFGDGPRRFLKAEHHKTGSAVAAAAKPFKIKGLGRDAQERTASRLKQRCTPLEVAALAELHPLSPAI